MHACECVRVCVRERGEVSYRKQKFQSGLTLESILKKKTRVFFPPFPSQRLKFCVFFLVSQCRLVIPNLTMSYKKPFIHPSKSLALLSVVSKNIAQLNIQQSKSRKWSFVCFTSRPLAWILRLLALCETKKKDKKKAKLQQQHGRRQSAQSVTKKTSKKKSSKKDIRGYIVSCFAVR